VAAAVHRRHRPASELGGRQLAFPLWRLDFVSPGYFDVFKIPSTRPDFTDGDKRRAAGV